MKKEIGKLYSSNFNLGIGNELVILCTGLGKSERTFSGVVVKQSDDYSDHKFGNYSESWTWHEDFIEEYNKPITLDNKNWKEIVEIGNSPGN